MYERLNYFLSLMEVRFVLAILILATVLDVVRRFLTVKKIRLYKNLVNVVSRRLTQRGPKTDKNANLNNSEWI